MLFTVPFRALLDQFASDFGDLCKVGTGHNQKIDLDAKGFIAVTKSVHLLPNVTFEAVFVDEAHHPLPPGMPKYKHLYRFSATHTDEPHFRYTMEQAIDDGVLCDYDITVPAVTEHHAYVCLADLLLKQAGQFRRVLAYCNTVREAKKFRMVVEELGLAAWHINAATSRKGRMAAIEEFSGDLTKPVHVLVTVEVLGEGINIPNADTCMFVEPRHTYRSVIQAVGRVLRHHPGKTLAHIVYPDVPVPVKVDAREQSLSDRNDPHCARMRSVERHQWQHENVRASETIVEGTPVPMEQPSTGFTATSAGERSQTQSLSIQKSVAFAPPSNGQYGDVSKIAADKRLGERIPIGRDSGTKSLTSERLAEKARANREASADAAAKLDRKKAALDEFGFGSSLGLGSLHENPVLEASEKTLHLGPFKNTHQRASLSQETLKPFDKGDSDAICASWQQSLPVDDIGGAEAVARHGDQVIHGLVTLQGSHFKGSGPEAGEKGRQQRNRGLQLKPSAAVSGVDQLFSTQVERFLSLLVQADSRLVGSKVGHRIRLVDCRLSREGELGGWVEAVSRKLSAILHQRDPWEQQVQCVEDFAAENGRLPARTARTARTAGEQAERRLASWVSNQGNKVRGGQLQRSRVQRLLNSSSPLLQQRVEGWLLNDPDCSFRNWCVKLRQHVERYGKLPTAAGSLDDGLATWFKNQKSNGLVSNPCKREMLESVHPLVAERIAKWAETTYSIRLPVWYDRLEGLVNFVVATNRLPTRSKEPSLRAWLNAQLGRLGQLPEELVEQLRLSHPLIAAAVAERSAKECTTTGLLRRAVTTASHL